MPNTRRYMPFHSRDNEWLAGDPPTDDTLEEWNEQWELLKQDCPHQIEFSEDMYCNSEYAELPVWIDVTIKDEYILPMKMARGVIKSIEGAQSIVFHLGIDCGIEDGWGGIGHEEIAITDSGAYVTLSSKHSSEEVDVDVSEQFNQAIGETA